MFALMEEMVKRQLSKTSISNLGQNTAFLHCFFLILLYPSRQILEWYLDCGARNFLHICLIHNLAIIISFDSVHSVILK
jgi:hypothetical protein